MKKKIMVVDDDQVFLKEMEETLCSVGFQPLVFSDANHAFRKARKVQPDVVLLDLKMKGQNGFQLADRLSRLPEFSDVPIIAMTGFFTQKEHTFLMDVCGIQSHLIKPFYPLDVIERINEALKQRKKEIAGEKSQKKTESRG